MTTNIKLGTTKATISGLLVMVQVYKFDSIRQEAYWVIDRRQSRVFSSLGEAEAYAVRFNK